MTGHGFNEWLLDSRVHLLSDEIRETECRLVEERERLQRDQEKLTRLNSELEQALELRYWERLLAYCQTPCWLYAWNMRSMR